MSHQTSSVIDVHVLICSSLTINVTLVRRRSAWHGGWSVAGRWSVLQSKTEMIFLFYCYFCRCKFVGQCLAAQPLMQDLSPWLLHTSQDSGQSTFITEAHITTSRAGAPNLLFCSLDDEKSLFLLPRVPLSEPPHIRVISPPGTRHQARIL